MLSRQIKGTLLKVALLAFVGGILFGGGFALANKIGANNQAATISQNTKLASDVQSTASLGLGPDTIADIVKKAGPAVVKIDTVVENYEGFQNNPFFNDPFFRQFFGGDYSPQPQIEHGIGSGFIISPDGYILTNEHVIDHASKINVTVEGYKNPFPATLVGSDYDLDLAVLKINASNLPVLPLGDSNQINVGDWVIAIGNPYGLDHTVTVGVISAKGRPVSVEGRQYKNLLQTDASINPGNSGGPLINLQGQVVGINTAINAQAQGIGFAIPTSTVKGVLEELIKQGKVTRPWLGVEIQPVTGELAQYYGYSSTQGAIIAGVVPGSPAAKSGLQQGDIIVKINGQSISSPDDLVNMIQKFKVGQKIMLDIFRDGNDKLVPVTIAQK